MPAEAVHLMLVVIEDMKTTFGRHMETPRISEATGLLSSFRGCVREVVQPLLAGLLLVLSYWELTTKRVTEDLFLHNFSQDRTHVRDTLC